MWKQYRLSVSFFSLICLLLIIGTHADVRRTPARVLAKQTGATQFEEERFETDCNEHKHHLKKRASDEDVDYEVYQGVVGRPGIDFPIYPRIPRTSFSCKSFGNGYFADMETDCQVFHICEEGRKISFLCPNGTIFQQSELTCDWWFKVNCLGSSGYYAESSEILNKQRVQRIRPSVPVQGFNILGGGLNIKPKVPNNSVQRSRHSTKAPERERRIDSNEAPSVETLDFDDISGEKQLKVPNNKITNLDNNHNNNNNNDETQITAESGSFAEAGRRHNSLHTDHPNETKSVETKRKNQNDASSASKNKYTTSTARNAYNGESTENARLGNRGHQRYKDELKNKAHELDKSVSEESREYKSIALPDKIIKPIVPFEENTPSSQTASTPSYTTTRFTTFYTPTVPLYNKPKISDGKTTYVKGNLNEGQVTTTVSPNRFNGHLHDHDEKSSTKESNLFNLTPRSVVIGMRHYVEGLQNDILPTRNPESREYLPTTKPFSTGPTYLPKNKSLPKNERESSGESLLFAPISTADNSVSRNLDEMLKTINIIRNKLDQVENQKLPQSRAGLEIPPSSGPDALVSLAQYFAGESLSGSTNSLYGLGGQKANKYYEYKIPSASASKSTSKFSVKASEATASLTSPQAINVDVKKDDIGAGLLSEKTVNKYTDLFGITNPLKEKPQTENQTTINNNNNNNNNSFATEVKHENKPTSFPQIGSTDATIRQLAEKPESRSIAQVFSNALTTYLEDPKTFRQQLVSIRPTEPPAVTKKSNFVTASSIDSSDFKDGTAASYLPTIATTLVGPTTTQSSIAAEINSKFEHSTPFVDISSTTTEILDFVTNNDSKNNYNTLELSGEQYQQPAESNESDEILKEEQSLSFVTPRNKSPDTNKDNPFKTTSTENPWRVSEKNFLDPLTINDGLMKTTKSTTASPITYISIAPTIRVKLSKNRPIFNEVPPTSQKLQVPKTDVPLVSGEVLESPYDKASDDTWQDIFTRYEIPLETLPSNNGLQRIANKLFGGLNETEALHLKNVMQQAEHNRQVLSLLLLLIQTCDDQNGRALERSRKHLLNALIDMDTKIQNDSKQNYKTQQTPTTERVPVTTYRRTDNNLFSTTTISSASTSAEQSTSSTISGSLEETTKFEIRVEELEEDNTQSASNTTPKVATSDQRALELLKSLYSLASKFTSRR